MPSAYDNDGDPLTNGSGTPTTTYAWDFENRLTGITLPNSAGTITFRFDPFGRRIYTNTPAAGTTICNLHGKGFLVCDTSREQGRTQPCGGPYTWA